MMQWQEALDALPLIAILRGLRPEEAADVAAALSDSGFRIVEVPLNSPRPFESIEIIAKRFGAEMLVGGGTVLSAAEARSVHDAGGTVVVAPNLDNRVAEAAAAEGMIYCPGVQTATEAFRALELGAAALKLFPAEMIPPAAVKALSAVLPQGTPMVPVGGITPEGMAAYLDKGAHGFGLGSALYKPGKTAAEVGVAADAFVRAFRQAVRR